MTKQQRKEVLSYIERKMNTGIKVDNISIPLNLKLTISDKKFFLKHNLETTNEFFGFMKFVKIKN